MLADFQDRLNEREAWRATRIFSRKPNYGKSFFRVDPLDSVVLAAVTVFVLLIAITATLLPARRAVHMDPAEVLRRSN